MSMKNERTREEGVEVRELIELIRGIEVFLNMTSYDKKNLVLFLRKLRQILDPLADAEGEEFLEALRQSLRVSMKLGGVETVTLEKLKDLVSNDAWSTRELLYIAEKRLEIPTGSMKKMKKEVIKSKILSTIQNIQKLDAIQKKASE